jgi:glycosyltransferase involved in cell wall biosynthesis
MQKLFHEHHALLSLSQTETFGMVIVEALACGKPVVATLSGGPQTYWEPEYGLLSEHTIDSVIQNMKQVERDYYEYNSKTISSSILSKFGTSSYCSQLESILQTCV